MDAVSAACPYCRILLVEANDNSFSNLFATEDQAVAQGARFVSNSGGANEFSGWRVFGGTSVSAPLLAAMYALAGIPGPASPNSFPYARRSAFNDIVTGTNGSCGGSYVCTAVAGYDGPTGIGTRDGVAGLTNGPIGQLGVEP